MLPRVKGKSRCFFQVVSSSFVQGCSKFDLTDQTRCFVFVGMTSRIMLKLQLFFNFSSRTGVLGAIYPDAILIWPSNMHWK